MNWGMARRGGRCGRRARCRSGCRRRAPRVRADRQVGRDGLASASTTRLGLASGDASVGGTITSVVDISSPELGLRKGTCSDEPLPDCGWAGSAVVRDVFDVGFAVLPECEKVRRGQPGAAVAVRSLSARPVSNGSAWYAVANEPSIGAGPASPDPLGDLVDRATGGTQGHQQFRIRSRAGGREVMHY